MIAMGTEVAMDCHGDLSFLDFEVDVVHYVALGYLTVSRPSQGTPGASAEG